MLLSRDMSVVPTQGPGSGFRGRTEGCTCTTCSRNVLDEGAAVYDVCEWARLRKVELPRGAVGSKCWTDDGILCLAAERLVIRDQDGEGAGAGRV